MNSNNSITQNYHHLNLEERIKIEIYKKEGLTITAIALKLGRNKSTISKEIKRNQVIQRDTNLKEQLVYFGDTGQIKYKQRKQNCGAKLKIVKCFDNVKYIEEKILNNNWSPDTAVGRYKLEYSKKPSLSTKTIYNYIDLGLINIKPIDLLLKVKLKTKKHRVRKNKRILGESIDNRPLAVNRREEVGHWEIDTIVGKRSKSSVLMTLTERKTRLEIIMKIPSKSNQSVIAALKKIKGIYGESFNERFKSITCDNGSEFSFNEEFKGTLPIDFFYTHPYSSFERGTNENHNGIIRRFIPKGKSIDDISDEMIDYICNWMNILPRKILGYRTPIEVFSEDILTTCA